MKHLLGRQYLIENRNRYSDDNCYAYRAEWIKSEHGDLAQNDRLHTGKEFNAFSGLYMYDNVARYLDPIFNRFTTPDPLAEKYPNFSPYTSCANNPLKYIDPTGMEWVDPEEEERLNEGLNERKKELQKEIEDRMEKLIKRGVSVEDIASDFQIKESNYMIGLLEQGLEYIQQLGSDVNKYTLNKSATGTHYVTQREDGIISIDASSMGYAMHEITHVAQSLSAGGLTFKNGVLLNSSTSPYLQPKNEIKAYHMQFATDGSFPGNVRGISEININSVGSLRKSDGTYMYHNIQKLIKEERKRVNISK